jgi:GNAT superfamily N-acetyltransferase
MQYKKNILKDTYAVKIIAEENAREVGRLYLYILKNDLHTEPFGFLEDLFVNEQYRKQGIGSELVKTAIEEAKRLGCYKLVGNSRNENEKVHVFYERFGFKRHGYEFRIDLK